MSPIHLSPHKTIHLSPNLAGGVGLSACLQFICLPLKQLICLPVWLVASGSPDVSNSFVSPYSNQFVSHCDCGWWCPALRMSPIDLSPLIATRLSPSLAGGVQLSWCLQFICLPVWLVVSGAPDVSNSFVSPYSNSFVSQSGWWCPALLMSPIHLSCFIAIHLSPSLAGGIWLSACFQFICLPLQKFICLPVWLGVSGSTYVFNSFVSPYNDSFVSKSAWWCPALRMSPVDLSPLIAIHLSPLLAIHLSPVVAGGVRLSGCLQIHVSSLWRQFICLPVWLVLSGCPFVSPYSNSFVSQSGWWCPALRMSAIDLSPIIAIHLFPSLAGGVRLYGCLRFICLALQQFICLPVWLGVSGSTYVFNSFVSPYNDSFVSKSGWWCPALRMSPVDLSFLIAIHLSPIVAGGVRLSGCLQFICLPL